MASLTKELTGAPGENMAGIRRLPPSQGQGHHSAGPEETPLDSFLPEKCKNVHESMYLNIYIICLSLCFITEIKAFYAIADLPYLTIIYI